MRRLVGICIALLSCSCVSKPTSPTRETASAPVQRNDLQSLVDQARNDGKLPAIGARMEKDGRVEFFQVRGKRAQQLPDAAQLSDKWHLGSDTKAMTALLVALAVQEGKISYDAPLASVFKTSPPFHALNRDLTVSALLIHQSGLKDVQAVADGALWKKAFASKETPRSQRLEMTLAALSESPRLMEKSQSADRSYEYGNINYVALGSMLETIYGKSWEELLPERLFSPLGMKTCGFGVPGDENETSPSQPWPHVVDKGELVGAPPKYKLDNPPLLGPAGTVHCNLDDWQRFVSELTSAWHGRGRLLEGGKGSKYFQAAGKGNDYTFGGWGRNDDEFGTPVFQHNGSNTFNYAVAIFAPERATSVLLTTNSGTQTAADAMKKLKASAYQALMRK